MNFKRLICAGTIAAAAVGVAVPNAMAATTITGAGSTLVAPIMSDWALGFGSYTPNVAYSSSGVPSSNFVVSYSPVGSGTGIADVSGAITNFGASDFTLAQKGSSAGSIDQVPWALTSSDIAYHVPGINGVKTPIKLTATLVAEMFNSKITNWDNPAIQKLNTVKKVVTTRKTVKVGKKKKVVTTRKTELVDSPKLPNLKITPVYRTDGSGDSYIMEEYLANSAASVWNASIPSGFNPSGGYWPWTASPAVGADGNPGVLNDLEGIKGSIGYVANPYIWTEAQTGPVYPAELQNKDGQYEFPNLANIQDASLSNETVPAQGASAFGSGVNIVDPGASYKTAYPVSTYTYGLIPTNLTGTTAQGVGTFLNYVVSKSGGQTYGPSLGYQPLPAGILQADQGIASSLGSAY